MPHNQSEGESFRGGSPAQRDSDGFRGGTPWRRHLTSPRSFDRPGSIESVPDGPYDPSGRPAALPREWVAVLITLCLLLAFRAFVWPWSSVKVDDRSGYPWKVALIICSGLPLLAVFRTIYRLTSNKEPLRRFGYRRQFRTTVAFAVVCMLLCNLLMHAIENLELYAMQLETVRQQGQSCPNAVLSATARRVCTQNPHCSSSNLDASATARSTGSPIVDGLKHRAPCTNEERRQTVTMVWMTDTASFGIRNQWSLESLLRHHPCARVQIIAPLLPSDFFESFVMLGYNVVIVPFNIETFAPFVPAPGAPGAVWVQKRAQWRDGPYFSVHRSDILRMLVLYRHGGTYMDFDHIVVRPMLHVRNGVGSEVCFDDNPDCLTPQQLHDLGLVQQQTGGTVLQSNVLVEDFVATRVDDFVANQRERIDFNVSCRYTPCNGVLINWEPHHPIFAEMLRTADAHYNQNVWGILGPRLWGNVLLKAHKRLKSRPRENSVVKMLKFELLRPAVLYPFAYDQAQAHLTTRVQSTEVLAATVPSLGVHFYGKMTAHVPMGSMVTSTMGRFVAAATLFGGAKDLWVVRKDRWCMPVMSSAAVDDEDTASAIRGFWHRHRKSNTDTVLGFKVKPAGRQNFEAAVRTASGTILVCREDWLGIREATMKLSRALGFPVVMVDESLARSPAKLLKLVKAFGVRVLLAQGIPPGIFRAARQLLDAEPSTTVGVVYHSGVALHNVAVDESALIGAGFAAVDAGVVHFAFIEEDQALWARHMAMPACAIPSTFVNAEQLRNIESNDRRAIPLPRSWGGAVKGDRALRIGLLGTTTRLAVKNFWTQIAAACMVPGAEIHVNVLPAGAWQEWHLNYCSSRVVVHGNMESVVFEKALKTMHLNMYASWTDAVPNVVGDSLAAGVPVILGDTTPWLDTSPLLRELLVEARTDDPNALYRRMLRVITFVARHESVFLREVHKMLTSSNRRAMMAWGCFVRGLAQRKRSCSVFDGTSDTSKAVCRDIVANPAQEFGTDKLMAASEAEKLFMHYYGDPASDSHTMDGKIPAL